VSIRFHLWLILIAACCTFSLGQSGVRDYRRAHERQILDEFTRLLAIPNIASDKENIRRNAELIREMMQRRGSNGKSPAPRIRSFFTRTTTANPSIRKRGPRHPRFSQPGARRRWNLAGKL